MSQSIQVEVSGNQTDVLSRLELLFCEQGCFTGVLADVLNICAVN